MLYNETLLVQHHQPFWFALRCFMEGSGRDRAMAVFHERGVRAFVQARGRNGRPEQDILYLAVQNSGKRMVPSDYDIWYRLLEKMCANAGHHHIQRLYTSIWSDQVELHEVFRQLAFQPYLRREVLQLSGPDWDQGTTLATMRPQSRSDAWAIHKLYGTVAPHLVQHAEARTPRTWNLSLGQRWQRNRRRGWVLGEMDNLQAYLRMQSGPVGHVLTMLVHPQIREQAVNVLRFGLAKIRDNKPVYLLLSEYQGELLTSARNLGFHAVGEQTLLMKSTTVQMRAPALLPKFEPGLEPRVTIPQISVPREDSNSYARSTQNNE
jgi:hypothetical protein